MRRSYNCNRPVAEKGNDKDMNLNSGRRSVKLSCRHCSEIGDSSRVTSSLIFLRDQWLPAFSVFCVCLCKQAAFAQKAQLEHQVQRFFWTLVASCRRCYFQWWMICRSYGTCLFATNKNIVCSMFRLDSPQTLIVHWYHGLGQDPN